ncbi:lytic transglycosylase domain-containing protein [Pseudomonas aeruginosa]|uniref:lytic transglycosylase domain-containing protein n=1 Tax=Pseudomonas aeruginosa TaxID=287 RepID=UPI000448499D|nr:lytic transglycosylase domain-containing protein [Pseudomonas aeruginosa]ETV56015.1 hypothetical protein Q042_05424 [Pseudomonas aeruginosa BWHPSA037]MBG6810225.1 lytic transglycosylase domain-containing protein [Pseudomonas aeruginosa]MBT9123919.1 lytic transglycosylase domain-containing protein [Pseudomonas aeruginosa]MCO1983806.1 lytic transglycosylase domain-containing protein [Pseudomonas aeruginosa]MCO4068051.1 lytic transglycosylase domain-containing protein [Pseudomonas aeruginosa]
MRRACVKPALLAFLWLCLVANSWASTFKVPLTATCLSEVAAAYQVHPDILLAILLVEGGTVGQVSRMNSNGTYDIGPFQINSTHRSALAAMHISEDELRNNGCTNAAVAGWLLRRAVSVEEEQQIKTPDEYLRAIARYHSTTPEYNQIYAERLKKAFSLLYAYDSSEHDE